MGNAQQGRTQLNRLLVTGQGASAALAPGKTTNTRRRTDDDVEGVEGAEVDEDHDGETTAELESEPRTHIGEVVTFTVDLTR